MKIEFFFVSVILIKKIEQLSVALKSRSLSISLFITTNEKNHHNAVKRIASITIPWKMIEVKANKAACVCFACYRFFLSFNYSGSIGGMCPSFECLSIICIVRHQNNKQLFFVHSTNKTNSQKKIVWNESKQIKIYWHVVLLRLYNVLVLFATFISMNRDVCIIDCVPGYVQSHYNRLPLLMNELPQKKTNKLAIVEANNRSHRKKLNQFG